SHLLTIDADGNINIAKNLNVAGNITGNKITANTELCVGSSCVDSIAWESIISGGGGGSTNPLAGYSSCQPVCGGNDVACPSGWSRAKFVMDGTGCGASGQLDTIAGPWTWGVAISRWMNPPSGTPPVYLQNYDYEYMCTPGSGYISTSDPNGWHPVWSGTCAKILCKGYSGYAPATYTDSPSSCAICCK
ncbi:MAG: hypothetical protein PHR31_02635, partial [Candidatus Pacebacteria bacterium]|nr:hypothetical protein [Candidatus Paceibacterota bacterium]